MRQFERSRNSSAWTPGDKSEFPADFTADERVFADELRDLFAVEREELPPRYAQTVLENERLAVAERGFEERLTYRVFQRLRMRRQLHFGARWALTWEGLRDVGRSLSRTLAAAAVAVFTVMVLSIMLETPSFAEGLRILFGQTGVVQVARYPSQVHSSVSDGQHNGKTTLAEVNMPLAWLGRSADGYGFSGVQALDPCDWSQPCDWAQGPVVDLQYRRLTPGPGTGLLDIREFQVTPAYAAVLQVVQAGYATQTAVGDSEAVYVDGAWIQRVVNPMKNAEQAPQTFYVWQPGQRSELILERNGVVFWIAGDQRDGLDQAALVQLAAQLQDVDMSTLQPNRRALRLAGDSLLSSFQQSMGRDVLQLVQVDASHDVRPPLFVTDGP